MSIKKAIVWIIFISCPSIILTGYAVYKIKEVLLINGVPINENIYWLILFFAMWAAMWLSSKRILKELFLRDSDKPSMSEE
jgi:hypothetical protein